MALRIRQIADRPDLVIREPGQGSIFDEEDVSAVAEALKEERLSYGPLSDRFDDAFAAYTGARYALSVSSCSTALALCAQLLRLGPNDEVIMTPQTFWATAVELLKRGVRIVFGDIDPTTLLLDPKTVEERITPRTKALYVTDYGGTPADYDVLMAIARRRGLKVVEDAAHAVGASYRGKRVGTLADLTCFSFHSHKNMCTLGEGGMITTDNEKWAAEMSKLHCIGMVLQTQPRVPDSFGPYERPKYSTYDASQNAYTIDAVNIEEYGNNYRMSDVQAAVGLVQLKKLEGFNTRRRAIAARLDAGLREIDGMVPQQVPDGVVRSCHLYLCFLQPERFGANEPTEAARVRNRFIELMETDGKVSMFQRFFPLHLLPALRAAGHRFGECPVLEKTWFERHINLPINPRMTDADVDFILTAVQRTVDRIKKER